MTVWQALKRVLVIGVKVRILMLLTYLTPASNMKRLVRLYRKSAEIDKELDEIEKQLSK